jgi:hypothetical protein
VQPRFNHLMQQDMPGLLTTDHALIGMRDRWGLASGGLIASGFSEVDGPARGLTTPGWPLPPGFDPSRPHKYGYLWIRATATTKGCMKQFLDGVPRTNRVPGSGTIARLLRLQ